MAEEIRQNIHERVDTVYSCQQRHMIDIWLEKHERKFVDHMPTFVCGSTVIVSIIYQHKTGEG
jgi:hypothetical protein